MVIRNPTLLEACVGDLYVYEVSSRKSPLKGKVATRITSVNSQGFRYSNHLLELEGERYFKDSKKDSETIIRPKELESTRKRLKCEMLFRVSLRTLEECNPIY
jgi:hypothetical protein